MSREEETRGRRREEEKTRGMATRGNEEKTRGMRREEKKRGMRREMPPRRDARTPE